MTVLLSQGPSHVTGPVTFTNVLVHLTPSRLRIFDSATPIAEVYAADVASYDLDQSRLPRDRAVTVILTDGTVLTITALPGACACAGGSGRWRGYVVPAEQDVTL